MGLITRSEAEHRLKIIAASINQAIREIRDGAWQRALTDVDEAIQRLDVLAPHIMEASNSPQCQPEPLGSLKYGTPSPITGGMGYRGSSHSSSGEFSSSVRVTSIERTPSTPKTEPAPPPPIPEPIPVRKPIITPPPSGPGSPRSVPRPSSGSIPRPIPPVVPTKSRTVKFDLRRMSGQEEYFLACKADPHYPSMTDDEWEAKDIFDALPVSVRQVIAEQFRRTGLPVTYHVAEGRIE